MRLVEPVFVAGPQPGRGAARPRGDRRGRPEPAPGDAGSTALGTSRCCRLGRAGRARAAARRLLASGPHGWAQASRRDQARGKAFACKLYQVGGAGRSAGVLKAAGARRSWRPSRNGVPVPQRAAAPDDARRLAAVVKLTRSTTMACSARSDGPGSAGTRRACTVRWESAVSRAYSGSSPISLAGPLRGLPSPRRTSSRGPSAGRPWALPCEPLASERVRSRASAPRSPPAGQNPLPRILHLANGGVNLEPPQEFDLGVGELGLGKQAFVARFAQALDPGHDILRRGRPGRTHHCCQACAAVPPPAGPKETTGESAGGELRHLPGERERGAAALLGEAADPVLAAVVDGGTPPQFRQQTSLWEVRVVHVVLAARWRRGAGAGPAGRRTGRRVAGAGDRSRASRSGSCSALATARRRAGPGELVEGGPPARGSRGRRRWP